MNPANSGTLRRALYCTIPLWICAAPLLLADVTIRYETGIKTAPFLPPQAREQMQKSMAAGGGKYALYMRNGKGLASAGLWTSMVDFTSQQMTLIDIAHQTFSTLSMADLPDKMAAMMPQMPEEAKKYMAAMKTSFDSRKMGRTETIQGIRAEEREMTMSIEMPLAPGAPQAGMTMKMVMRIWTAKSEEALRNQAIRELMGYNLWANYFMNPAGLMQKMTASMPGMGDSLKSMMDELARDKAVMLRTHTAMYMQLPPEVLKKLAEQSAAGAMDPTAPLFEMTQEAVEVSSTPIEESVFRIPADYKAVAADALLKSIMQSQMAAMGTPAP